MIYKLANMRIEISFLESFELGLTASDDVVFIVDMNVANLHKQLLEDVLMNKPVFLFNATEANKNLEHLHKIYNFFLNNNVKRSTVVVVIGGGITTDISAYAASTYKRGCRLNLVPTTLLGMVDASIGGKTAVNFEMIKNNIGSFYPAEKIIIFPLFLQTLGLEEYMSGLAEVIKCALIETTDFYDELLREKIDIKDIISRSIDFKMKLCQQDLYDKKERRLLNLGHTFAHVIESATQYNIKHGIAVALGIRMAAKLSVKRNTLSNMGFERINEILDNFSFPNKLQDLRVEISKAEIEKIIKQDKKNDQNINLILLSDEGAFVESGVSLAEIVEQFL
ncbi:MAG: 3-dehydroquinate synthase [Candidatus Cloacimonetes bacterium]|nr:3-dehydroquinate synthase [Candidatus Cloacimonadota bacterium]